MTQRDRARAFLRGTRSATLLLLISTAISIAIAGCWHRPAPGAPPRPTLGDGVGALAVTAAMDSPGSSAGMLHVVLQHVGLIVEHSFPIVDGKAEGVLEGIYEGRWDVALEVRDDDGVLTHRGTAQVTIFADKATDLHVTLEPLPGTLFVQVDLSGFRDEARVDRARLNIYEPSHYVNAVREGPEPIITWDHQLPPGTYDVHIGLYNESFHQHRLIYAGPWFQVDVHPGRTTEASWHPATGEVRFAGIVRQAPQPPRDVTASRHGDTVIVEWAVPSPRAVESVLWWTDDPFVPPREIVRIPTLPGTPDMPRVHRFEHRPGDEGALPGSFLVYGVTTVDGDGLHSLRVSAPPLYWPGDAGGSAEP